MTGGAGALLIVDDDPELRRQISLFFRRQCQVETASGRDETRRLLANGGFDPDVALVDMHLPPHLDSAEEGIGILQEIAALRPRTVRIAMSGDPERATGFHAVAAGAYDFFAKPIDTRELEIIVRRAFERRRLADEIQRQREDHGRQYRFDSFIGESAAMQRVLATITKVADSNASVLIQGESGTGKELVARALHAHSKRADGPFVAVNCSAIPDTLVESELFGHEKGSFTGAIDRRIGRFEQADGGTLFLDELGTLNAAAQAKLLRVLETRTFERVGGKESIQVDLRVVAATNQDLDRDTSEGKFREDLLYRIRVVSLVLPPLRDRREDIPALVAHYLALAVRDHDGRGRRLSPAALEALIAHRWKGNVRELRHVIESLVLLADGETIEVADLPPQIVSALPGSGRDGGLAIPEEGFRLEEYLARHERDLLRGALQKAAGVKTQAARLLGVNKDRMRYLCRKHDL
jgi:two-component system response regulator PilR (NtrC family)